MLLMSPAILTCHKHYMLVVSGQQELSRGAEVHLVGTRQPAPRGVLQQPLTPHKPDQLFGVLQSISILYRLECKGGVNTENPKPLEHPLPLALPSALPAIVLTQGKEVA